MKKTILLFLLALMFVLTGCLSTVEESKITFDFQDKNVTVEVGDTFALQPVIIGFHGNTVIYTSSADPFDPCISVSNTGVITAIKEGSASIIAKLDGAAGVATVQISVTVVPKTENPNGGNDNTSLTVTITGGVQNNKIISAFVGDVIQLGIFANKTYTETPVWKSSDISKGFISSSGLFTALDSGTTKIELTVGTATDFVFVTILAKNQDPEIVTPQITSILISGPRVLTVGNNTNLTVTPDKDVLFTVLWTSNNNGIATIDASGKVTANSAGVVVFTATLSSNASIKNTWTMMIQDNTPTNTITGISLSGDSNLFVGNKMLLTVNFTPAGETGNVTWSTSNAAIASVAASGLITGVAQGSVTITATLNADTSITGSKTITVVPKPSSITVSGATSMNVGSTTSLTATILPADTVKTVIWSSNNTNVATVSNTGVVTALSAGVASIVVTSTVDSTIFGKLDIMVNATQTPTLSLSISSSNINVGSTAQITATVGNTSNTAVTYSSSNTSVATVDATGKVTGVAAGSATITGRLVVDNSVTSSVAVTIASATPTVSVSPTSTTVYVGSTKQLTATVTNTSNTSVTWSSSNTSVATVSSSGVVTAVAAGSATITATSVANTSAKATCAVTVSNPPAGTLTITADPSASVPVGGSGYQLYVKDSNGTSVSRLECTFTSSDSSVATVSSYGTISALKDGSATITVTHSTKGTGTITLTIGSGGGGTPPVNPPAGTLTVTADPSATVPIGASGYQLYVKDSNGTSLSRQECTFTSSNSSVATVSVYGTISALAAGTAIINVTHPTGGSGAITLTVGSSGADPFDRIITFGSNPTYSSNATQAMTNPFYWLRMAQNNGVDINATLLTTTEITAQNNIMIQQGNMRLVNPSTLANKTSVTSSEVESLRSTFGYSLPSGWTLQSTVQHAVVTSFAQMKSYPTTSTDKSYMETGLEVGEGVAIYGKYSSGSWLLVRSQNYFGWIQASTVGTCSGSDMATFANPSSFAIITAERIKTTQISGLPTMLRMGTKLPLISSNATSATVRVPTRNSNGTLNTTGASVTIPIDSNEYVHVGYLPYSTKNIIKQMFKMLGQVYGWGDINSDRDCSSTVWTAYKCSGFLLPRNTSQQELISNSTYAKVYPSGNIGTSYSTYLPNVRLGAILLMKGHVMLYLGKVDSRYYIIHQYGSLYCQVTDTRGYSLYNTKTFIK
ncbi:MAG: Ig-like domain-containing protein [Bacilli bacterium]